MTVRNIGNKYKIIHVAKKQLGLDDDAYRAVLSGAGVTSSRDINTDAQFNTVMSAFLKLGFKSNSDKVGKYINTVTGASGMISRRQEYYIKGLWALASRYKDEKSLRKIIKRIGKVDDISFLSKRDASAVILALRDICWKAGFNPDTREGVCFGQ
ncbi:MAG: regulatory protein GemA [Treponema sp.]|nr:regulatory protein GemA [Treponema sp.]